ncbi:MAG TPA: winged helix-turn-helix transcriptional regulator [Candidatus Nanoarchaeia archaeon]|nr:winged helix-turn-helix transcriptional regulator [Candidatus Nanoarchaeia archaeon]
MEKLDLKDRKILYQLDLDARQSDSHIAKKVKLSRDAVKYRINKLLEKGFINYFMTVLNSMKLGFNWYRTFFKFQNLTVEKEEEIIGWLRDKASWITKVEGIWDLNTGIFVKDVYEYRDIINEFLVKYGEYIDKYEVAIVTREWIYHHDYLLNKKQKTTTPQLMGYKEKGNYKIEKIDKIDYKILSALLKNARMKTIDIAKKINSTEMVVRYRIKKMMENGIIIGFRPFLNVHKLNYIYFKTHFTLHNLTPEKKKKIFDYIHVHPNTVHTTELVGGADLETEFQVTHNNEFHEYIKDIRLRFGDIIRDYEFMQYTQEYKFTYLPEIQFKV